ncbi:MAG: hypothetical protein MI892_00190, partial [Desulfobacterales bacterium]|nr:hypothetical protein [Desulfobacterales bacterium]
RGQYEGYRAEDTVNPESTTETYVEMEMRIHNFRWEGVPIFVRTGKALGCKGTRIGLRFRKLPRLLYNGDGALDENPNRIIFNIQPTTGIIIDHAVKVPGTDRDITQSPLDFSLAETFGEGVAVDAYQRLLMDALEGDRTLYVGSDETELAWKVLEGVLDAGELFLYRQGRMPDSPLGIDWIDFRKYESACEDD